MEVLSILDKLEELIEGSSKPMFGGNGKIMMDKEEALEIIRDIRIGLPDDFKQAEWITQERQKIIDDAKTEAETIVKSAKSYANDLIQEHAITQRAEARAKEINEQAVKDGIELRNGAIEYSQGIISKLCMDIKEVVDKIEKNHNELNALKVPTNEEEGFEGELEV
ncbi:MAG: ATPase [Filifactoraceae bacterium]